VMRHPGDGTLRRLLDEPAGVADADYEHVLSCSLCGAALSAAQDDAAFAATALAVDAEPDLDEAWERFARALAVEEPVAPSPVARRRRFSVRGRTATLLGVAVLLGGAGAAAATDWLQIFRAEEVTPLPVNQADLVALPDLSDYGELKVIKEPNVRSEKDARSAAQASGLEVPEVRELPRGVTGVPAFQVGEQASAVFTFSAAKAAEAAAKAGRPLPPPPAGMDGGQFRLLVGPGVAAVWAGNSGLPALLVGRAKAPTAFSTGVPLETARDYLLSLPGLPAEAAAQLQRFPGRNGTFPLPVPADELTTSTADIRGTRGTVFRSPDSAMTGVVWVQDRLVNVVAGSLSEDEVLSVARGLR
jgi:hypothetical protein